MGWYCVFVCVCVKTTGYVVSHSYGGTVVQTCSIRVAV